MSDTNNGPVTITIETATTPGQVTRERRYASGAKGGSVSMTVGRSDAERTFVTRWNVNSGPGWHKGWKATRTTEAEAFAFVAEKWPTLMAWLEKLEPKVREGGAAAAFSAQVASMSR